jgi:hypothetical protein
MDEHLKRIPDERVRDLGRRAIGYVIRHTEDENKLFPDTAPQDHWYRHLAAYFADYPARATHNHFSFLTFNYDRSLSHFLYNTLLHRKHDEEEIKKLLGPKNLFHIHGHVGNLPWQFDEGGDRKSYFQYGAHLSVEDLCTHSPEIRLIHDSVVLEPALEKVISSAQVIVFVGFAFHEANLVRLGLAEELANADRDRWIVNVNPFVAPNWMKNIKHFSGGAEETITIFLKELATGSYREPPPLQRQPLGRRQNVLTNRRN